MRISAILALIESAHTANANEYGSRKAEMKFNHVVHVMEAEGFDVDVISQSAPHASHCELLQAYAKAIIPFAVMRMEREDKLARGD